MPCRQWKNKQKNKGASQTSVKEEIEMKGMITESKKQAQADFTMRNTDKR